MRRISHQWGRRDLHLRPQPHHHHTQQDHAGALPELPPKGGPLAAAQATDAVPSSAAALHGTQLCQPPVRVCVPLTLLCSLAEAVVEAVAGDGWRELVMVMQVGSYGRRVA